MVVLQRPGHFVTKLNTCTPGPEVGEAEGGYRERWNSHRSSHILTPTRSTEFAFITSSSWLSSGSDPPRDNRRDWDEDQEDWLEKHIFLSFDLCCRYLIEECFPPYFWCLFLF